MPFKLISKEGDFLPMLLRISEEGEDVRFYIEKEGAKEMYDGILPSADGPYDLNISGDDIVLFDMVGAGSEAEALKRKGYHVIGGGELNDSLELDRAFGQKTMADAGIPVPKTSTFRDFPSAVAHITGSGKRFVFKPHGNLETNLTYVSTSEKNLLGMLPFFEGALPEHHPFDLQEYVEGIEMSTEGWFNGTQFILPLNSTMEEKALFPGNVGPFTGCMGNVVWFWPEDFSHLLYETLFQRLEPVLADAGYLGPLDINCIWTDAGPFGLEFTARFGYDAIQAMSRLIEGGFGDFLRELEGLPLMPVREFEQYSVAVRVSIPPYPHEGKPHEVPILGLSSKDMASVYLSDVQYVGNDLRCAGYDGYILCVAENSESLSRAQQKVYSIIEKLEIPEKQYRIDIGDRVSSNRQQVETILRNLLTTSHLR